MKAMVLVGGRGTRFRPLTFAVPKPLLAVGDKPLLQHLLERLSGSGITDVTLATGYLAELIEAFCGDGRRFGLRITYCREPMPLGTAGPLSLLRGRVAEDEFFLLMNGDIVTDLPYGDLLEFARKGDHPLTVAYVEHTYKSPFGVLQISGGLITDVVEKPEMRSFVSSGIYAVKGSALRYVPDHQFFTVPDLIQRLRAAGERVAAYPVTGLWVGVEDLGELEKVRALMGLDAPKVEGG
jgi:NDP-sugar pyrophosphorylase family protein